MNNSREEAHRTPPIYNPDCFRPLPRRKKKDNEKERADEDKAGATELEEEKAIQLESQL